MVFWKSHAWMARVPSQRDCTRDNHKGNRSERWAGEQRGREASRPTIYYHAVLSREERAVQRRAEACLAVAAVQLVANLVAGVPLSEYLG